MGPSNGRWPRPGVDTVADALVCFPAGQGILMPAQELTQHRYTSCKSPEIRRKRLRNMCCVPGAIEQAIADIEGFAESAVHLADRLHRQAAWSAEDVERLRSGMSMADACVATNSAERSRTLTRALAEFEASRRAIRASTVLALLDEGMSITDIGKVFGVSRQLANRLVKDARALADDASTTI